MNRFGLTSLCLVGVFLLPRVANATRSAELYTSSPYGYGRFEARMRVTAGDGVVSAFFLWKEGSEQPGMYWNELDFEKIGANCQLHTNALYGNPAANHTQKPTVNGDLCAGFHVYGYEWTGDYIAWFLDGTEVRRETGETAAAFAQNASAGMRIHFNVWPGDASFGGNFDPAILPVHQYVDWIQFSSYANGTFTLAWREDFAASTVPTGWATGDWVSPKNLSTHDPLNVNFLSGCAVLSMTADDATGPAGAMPDPEGCTPGMGGAGGTGGSGATAGTSGTAGTSAGGAPGTGGTADAAGGTSAAGAATAGGAAGGTAGASGTAIGGASGTAATTGGASGAGAAGPNGGAGAAAATSSGGTAGSPTTGGIGGASPGGASPLGGNPATGGAQATAGESAGDDTTSGDASGCGCRVPGSTRSSQPGAGAGAALLLALAGAFRRRRTSRARGLRSAKAEPPTLV